MCLYVVVSGSVNRSSFGWDSDGFPAIEECFSSVDEAEECYDSLDLAHEFSVDWDTSSFKPRDRGLYKALELWSVDEEGDAEEFLETLRYEEYTADDYLVDHEDVM